MKNEEPRKINDYTIEQAVYIGNKEVCFAADEKNESAPYLVCYGQTHPLFGGEVFFDALEMSDYVDAMSEYSTRLAEQVKLAKAERDERGANCKMLTRSDCEANSFGKDLTGKILIISPSSFRREYRTADHQLVLATGGFGCHPDAAGRAVYGTNLWDGKQARYEVSDVLGVAKPEVIPDWVEERRAVWEQAETIKVKQKGEVR